MYKEEKKNWYAKPVPTSLLYCIIWYRSLSIQTIIEVCFPRQQMSLLKLLYNLLV